jgi:RNA polymerase sigma-70 factor (ECF subfamily)
VGQEPDRTFVALLEATQGRIRSYVAGMGVPLADVDDLAQEVFLAYYREPQRRPPEVEPIAWLHGIARNRCNDYFRTRGRSSRRWEEIGRALERETAPPEAGPADELMTAALGRCLDRLPARHQEMLRWYYEEDASAEEIGRRLQRSAGAVRVAMLRLREALRDCIARALPEEPAR